MSNDQLSPHKGANYQLDAPVVSRRDGVLRADDFDDLYFDAQDGLAESQYVFIKGTQLPINCVPLAISQSLKPALARV